MPASDAQQLDIKRLDRQHHLHPFTDFAEYREQGGRIMSRGEGIFVYDDTGHEILDGMSGLWCTNLGYSQTSIVEAISAQLQTLDRAMSGRQ